MEFAAELYFGDYWNTAKTSFRNLIKHIEYASQRRDDIAHGYVMGITVNNIDHGYFLIPPEYNARMIFANVDDMGIDPLAFTRSKYRYSSAEIILFVNRYVELKNRIYTYMNNYKKENGQFPPNVIDKFQRRP